MSSVDVRARLHVVPERIAPAPAAAPPHGWPSAVVRVFGGFMLTGVFLALSAIAFVGAGIYGFLEFAKF